MATKPLISRAWDFQRFRKLGAQYQKWISNPNSEGCNIAPATLTRQQMLASSPDSDCWVLEEEFFSSAPMGSLKGGDPLSMNLAPGEVYLETHLTRTSQKSERWLKNSYHHIMGPGIIIAAIIFRKEGPHWNEIARALYDATFEIHSLKHIVFTDVTNMETEGYVCNGLYPGRNLLTNEQMKGYQTLQYGSPEYQQMLGTTLGKAVACLVLSSFPRGSVHISRVLTWWSDYGSLTIRFDIEPFASDRPVDL